MNGISILKTGSYIPHKRVTNDDMAKIVETNDEWIVTRTGIHARHFSENQDTTELAYLASLDALEGIEKEKIGLIIVATMSATYATPSTACLLQNRLGLPHDVLALDLSAACSGFVYALSVARSMLQDAKKPYALIVGAEKLSSLLDFTDRSTCILFGDGAGAVVVEKKEAMYYDYQGCDGNEEALFASREEGKMRMQGRDVFKFATRVLPECMQALEKESKIALDEVDYFIVHQANERIIAHVYKKMKISQEKFYMNLSEYGNTSAASIPLVIDEMNKKGLLKRGMKIMTIGFGGGLTYGANLFTW